MAPLVPYLIGAGIGLQAFGTWKAGVAAEAEAESAAAVAEYNAAVQQREAQAIEAQTEFRQRRQAEAGERQASGLLAALGASGVVVSEGTPLMILSRQAAESELENLMLGYEGAIGKRRALSQATIDRAQAGIYRQRGRTARTAGAVGAGTSLLSGFGELGYKYYGPKR